MDAIKVTDATNAAASGQYVGCGTCSRISGTASMVLVTNNSRSSTRRPPTTVRPSRSVQSGERLCTTGIRRYAYDGGGDAIDHSNPGASCGLNGASAGLSKDLMM